MSDLSCALRKRNDDLCRQAAAKLEQLESESKNWKWRYGNCYKEYEDLGKKISAKNKEIAVWKEETEFLRKQLESQCCCPITKVEFDYGPEHVAVPKSLLESMRVEIMLATMPQVEYSPDHQVMATEADNITKEKCRRVAHALEELVSGKVPTEL